MSIFVILQVKQGKEGIHFAGSSKLSHDTCSQKQPTLGTLPEPVAASFPCLPEWEAPVPAWPRQLKNVRKADQGPVSARERKRLTSSSPEMPSNCEELPRPTHTVMVGRIPQLWTKYKPVRKCLLTLRDGALSHAMDISWFYFPNTSAIIF